RDDRPRRGERQELQRQARALDHLAPASLVVAALDPALPEAQRAVKLLLAPLEEGLARRRLAFGLTEQDRDLVALAEDELRADSRSADSQGQRRRDVDDQVARGEPVSGGGRLGLHVRRARVVEGGPAFEVERDRAAHAADEPDDLVILLLLAARALPVDRHEV